MRVSREEKQSNRSSRKRLSEVAHDQRMDYLRLANESSDAGIRKAAIKLAEENQKHQNALDSRLSPAVALSAVIVVGIVAGVADWKLIVTYPGRSGLEITSLVSAFGLFLICVCLRLSGHLSEANLMIAFRWLGDKIKQITPWDKQPIKTISAKAEDE